jgi:hypothetical protein
MRIHTAFLLSSVVFVSACANLFEGGRSDAVRPGTGQCEVATVPRGAVFGVREGMDIATWPPELERGASGCQRVWYGVRQRPEAMQVLATYHYENGQVRRLVGRVPNGAAYDCHYRDGVLEAARSQNPAQCPKASEIDPRR